MVRKHIDDFLIIADNQGRIHKVIGKEKDFASTTEGKLLISLVLPSYFKEAMNFLIELKQKKVVVGWEFIIEEDSNNNLLIFSGIMIEDNVILIIANYPFARMDSLIPESIEMHSKKWEGLLEEYFKEKKVDLATKDEKRQDEFYRQYSQMNNQLVNLQRQMVKKNKELEEEKERFRVTLAGIADAVISTDRDGKINFINPAALKILDKKEEQVLNQNLWDIFKLKVNEDEYIFRIQQDIKKTGFFQGEDYILKINKEKSIPIDFNLSSVDKDKKGMETVLIFRDISGRKKKEEQLTNLASADILTGIYNRRMGMELLEKEIKIARRRNSLLSICFLDVDGLKTVNDLHGHQEGDKLLIKVAQVIKNSIRESDIFCRMGGDEFLIIFPESSAEAAEGVWLRILTNFQKINRSQECKYPMQVSHGIVEYRIGYFPKGKEIDSLIETADKKMYQEKQSHNKSR